MRISVWNDTRFACSSPRFKRGCGSVLLGGLFVVVGHVVVQMSPSILHDVVPTVSALQVTGRAADPGLVLEEARARWSTALFEADLIVAEKECADALKVFQTMNDLTGQARALDELGLIALKRKRPISALAFFEQSQKAAQAAGDRIREASAMEHMTQAYVEADQRPQALQASQQALALYREHNQPRGEARTLIHRGALQQRLGQDADAIQSFEQALAAADEIGDEDLIATALDHITWTFRDAGDLDRALSSGRHALAAHGAMGDREGEGYALAVLGDLFQATGQPDRAMTTYEQALAIGQQIKASGMEWKIQSRIALAHLAAGRTGEAMTAFEAAVRLIEAIPLEVMTDSYAPAIPLAPADVFRDYAEALLRSDPAGANVEKAFLLSEAGRAFGYLTTMVEAGVESHPGIDPLKVERERRLLQRMVDLKQRLRSPDLDEGERQELHQQWRYAEEELSALFSDLRAVEPRYAHWRCPAMLSVSEIRRQAVPGGTALLEYLLGRDRSYLFVMTAERLTVYSLPKTELVEQAIKAYHRFLTAGRFDSGTIVPPEDEQVQALGGQLYDTLIRPAQEVLNGTNRLVFVPDGWLHYLPFEALIRRDRPSEGRGWEYAVERYDISYAPSANILSWLRGRSERPLPGGRLMLIYDNAMGGSGEGSQPVAQGDDEVERIQLAIGMQAVDTRIHRSRDDPRLTPAELSRYRLVHLVVPTVFDESEPQRSAAALDVTGNEGRETPLSPASIMRLSLGAQLITLSHSHPRLQDHVTGVGLMSFTQSLIYAGSPAVVASLWDVRGPSTGEFMAAFYRLIRSGVNPEAALKATKVRFIREGAYRHPSYWSRFVLVGDGTGPIQVSSIGQTVVTASGGIMIVVLAGLAVALIRSRQQASIRNPPAKS